MASFVSGVLGLIIIVLGIGWTIVVMLAVLRIFSIDRTLKEMLAIMEGRKPFSGRFFPPREDDQA